MPPQKRWYQSLAARYGVVMILFVAAGSLLLLTWLRYQQQEEASRVFITLAKNDVDFVRRMNLPRSAKLATDLRQLLRMDIHFRNKAGQSEPELQGAESPMLAAQNTGTEVIQLPTGRQALILPLDDQYDMTFIRGTPEVTLSLWHPKTRYALLAFWLFSAIFAWIFGQQVVRPVGRLTRGLTGFFSDPERQLPETRRTDEIGELARAMTQARDDLSSERVRREQSERLALLGRVATGLAHEIKNPLASIQLHAQLMESVDLDPESQSSLGHLLAEVLVIEGLVNQWLYLARPASPKKQPLDVSELLKETRQMLQPQAQHAGVTLSLKAETGRRIMGDRLRLQQVFRNVIINGLQAMPQGGILDITLQAETAHMTVTFRDQGPGFSKAALEQSAELFFSEKEGGMGVGLNVAREIISAHDGIIVCKNHPESGAIVEITLPMINS
jgi:signal transduction histidine kinase